MVVVGVVHWCSVVVEVGVEGVSTLLLLLLGLGVVGVVAALC